MSTVICMKCGGVDNTAKGGNYWMTHLTSNKLPDGSKPDILCSQCHTGTWQNRFPRIHWSEYGSRMMIQEIIAEADKDTGSFVNAREFFARYPDGIAINDITKEVSPESKESPIRIYYNSVKER